MGILSKLVGGIFGGGGGGGGDTTTVTRQELAPEQQELLNLVLPAARDIIEQPPQLFPESQIAGFTPLQVAGQEGAVAAAGEQIAPLAGSSITGAQQLQGFGLPVGLTGATAAIGGLQPADAFLNFLLSGQALSPDTNPFLAATAEAAIRPLEQSFQQSILPGIRSEAIEAGQFGSSRQGIAEGIAGQELLAQQGDISSRIFSQGFSDVLGAATQALGTTQGAGVAGFESLLGEGTRSLFAAPALGDLALLPPSVLGSVGFQEQQLEQAQLSEEAQRFMTEQIIPFLVAQDVAQLAFGIPGGSVTSTSSGPSTSSLQTLLGLGGTALGFAFGGPVGGAVGGQVGSSINI